MIFILFLNNNKMKIKKRNGKFEQLSVDKIINRLKKIKNDTILGKLKTIDTDPIALKIVSSIYDGVTSSELDEEAARIAVGMTENIEYSILASRIIISNLHKNTSISFSDTMESLNNNIDINGNVASLLSDKFIENVRKYKDQIDSYIVYERDYLFDYFGFKTMERTYLMKLDGKVIERPQHMYMRVAIQTNLDDIDNILKTYDYISQHYFTFASPTSFNSGSKQNNLSSCFLLHTNDSVDGIFKTMSDVAKISKVGGGLGIHINNIRSKGALIRGSNGVSDGIIPMLKVYNELSAYINQCFTPDTWVYSQKGPKQIKDIITDDNLITIDGSFKKINEIIKTKVNKEILKIKTTNSLFPVKVTKEHELYLLKDCKQFDSIVIKKGLQNGSIKPDYYSADKLTLDDLVGFPIPMHVKNNDNNDLDYYKFYGLMLHLGEKNGNEYKITFKKHAESLFIKYYLEKSNIEYWSGSNYYTFTVPWTVNFKMDDSYLHLPNDKTLKLIEGLMCNGDIFQHKSKKLVIQTRYLLLRMGILTTGYIQNGVYHLKKTIKNKDYFEYENMLWGKVSYIHLMEYSGDVYDFNMIDNHNYMTEMGLVHNSGKRKGSIAFYLSPEHPDILDFLNLRKNNGAESLRARNLFLAMWISDLFMKQVEKNGDWYLMDPDECPGLDDVYGEEFETLYWKYVEEKRYRKVIKAQEIWSKIIESQIETGTPYMLYKDPSNKKSNQKNIGTIKSSNLCVAPETMILTSTGYYKIKELEGQYIKIWNGQEFTETIVRKTGENQELIKVKLSNGTELECTPYHKFYIIQNLEIIKIDAINLKPDMTLIDCKYPVIPCKAEALHQRDISSETINLDKLDKDYVPINNDIGNKLEWLKGLLNNYKIESFNKEFLENTKYLLQTLGCNPIIKNNNLLLTNDDLKSLYNLGFHTLISSPLETHSIQVEEIIQTNRISDTFCFTEEKRGMGIFNGIITGQCAEVLLYSGKDEYATCFTGDTPILTKEGYRPIKECDNKEVYSYFESDKTFEQKDSFIKAKLIDNGLKDVYELTCTGTQPIKVTDNHLFAVLTKRKHTRTDKINTYTWKQAKELTKDDKIIYPTTQILPEYDIKCNDITICEEFLTIGWMLGDGWQCKTEKTSSIYGVCFGPNETYARDRVIKQLNIMLESVEFKKNGYNKRTTDFYTDKNGVFSWASSKQNFVKYIQKNYGLMEPKAHFKRVPDKIKYDSKPIEIASFLSGLFSADGSVYLNKKRFSIRLTSASEELLYDTQQLLQCFGIKSQICYSSVKNNTNEQGVLSIENIESIKNYYKYINFILCKEKQDILLAGLKTLEKRTIYRDYKKIKSFKYIGQERVYDLNIPKSHNFIAGGFVVHNCNLLSMSLPKFIKYDQDNKPYYDFQELYETVKFTILPMNNVIDFNFYPVPETTNGNFRNRPIGIGTQGFNDLCVRMRLPFESKEADQLNKEIWETMYYATLSGSMELAKQQGPYSTFKGSPLSEGKLQFDLWKEYDNIELNDYLSGRWDWETLRQDIIKHGVRNSTLLCQMPTATSAIIMNNTESVECMDSCIYKRKTLSGEFTVFNKELVRDLTDLGLWNKELKDTVIANNGSIQNIDTIPDNIKLLYKTVWEINMKTILNQAKSRGVFICQTQSTNCFFETPTVKKLSSMHFYSWKLGLKTGMYYCRSKPKAASGQFTIDASLEKKARKKKPTEEEILACSIDNQEACDLCTS